MIEDIKKIIQKYPTINGQRSVQDQIKLENECSFEILITLLSRIITLLMLNVDSLLFLKLQLNGLSKVFKRIRIILKEKLDQNNSKKVINNFLEKFYEKKKLIIILDEANCYTGKLIQFTGGDIDLEKDEPNTLIKPNRGLIGILIHSLTFNLDNQLTLIVSGTTISLRDQKNFRAAIFKTSLAEKHSELLIVDSFITFNKNMIKNICKNIIFKNIDDDIINEIAIKTEGRARIFMGFATFLIDNQYTIDNNFIKNLDLYLNNVTDIPKKNFHFWNAISLYKQVEKYIEKFNNDFLINLVNGYYLNELSIICEDDNDLVSFGLAFLDSVNNKYIIKEVF
jgi:hypothetical protein